MIVVAKILSLPDTIMSNSPLTAVHSLPSALALLF